MSDVGPHSTCAFDGSESRPDARQCKCNWLYYHSIGRACSYATQAILECSCALMHGHAHKVSSQTADVHRCGDLQENEYGHMSYD